MRTSELKYRWLQYRLKSLEGRKIIVLTGARQTGKTTLVKAQYPSLRYLNLDVIEERDVLANVRTRSWGTSVGPAILDEAQKLPTVFDKVKWAFDERKIDFSVLTGSSRILLLEKIKETLAGRAYLYDLWPLMASEIRCESNRTPEFPLIHRILTASTPIEIPLSKEPSIELGQNLETRLSTIDHLMQWGGIPGLLPLSDDERHEWLRSYQQTFLERDLYDLVRMRDLVPFRTLQKLTMLRSGCLLSFSELARDSGIAVNTARRYLEYLKISYQVILLQPWYRNLTSQVIKSPKLYWVDMGLLRQGTGQWGALTGELYEMMVVSEIYKWINTMLPDVDMYFYRTRSGMEVDLILETRHGIIGIEIKSRSTISTTDLRGLRSIADHLKSQWLGGLVIYNGFEIIELSDSPAIWAVPFHRLV